MRSEPRSSPGCSASASWPIRAPAPVGPNVPAAVWTYRLGGYQVLKKWLSYRERAILDRPLLPDEVQHFTDTARRIAAILLTVDR